MHTRRLIIARLSASALLLACAAFPALAFASAPTVVSVVANGVTLDGSSAPLATSSSVWPVVVTFDQDIVTPPTIFDGNSTNFTGGTQQNISACVDSRTFCFTYATSSEAVATFWLFRISDAQNAASETMATTSSGTFLLDSVGPIITMPDVTTNVVLPTIGGTVDSSSFQHSVMLTISNPRLGISKTYTDSVAGLTWSVTLPFGDGLPEGTYSLAATGKDPSGNYGPTVYGTLIVSTSAPTLTIISGPAQNGFVGSSTAQFGFATSSLVSVATTCAFDTDAAAPCYGTFSTSTLVEGLHTFTATSTDFFGNQTVANRSFSVDLTAPVLAEVAPIATSTNTTPSYSFTSTEAGTLSYSGGCTATTTTAGVATTTIVFDALPAGAYASCIVSITDTAGNTGVLAVSPFTVDAVPVVVTTTSSGGSSGGGVIGGPLAVGYQTPYTAPVALIPTPPAGTPEPQPADTAPASPAPETRVSQTPPASVSAAPAGEIPDAAANTAQTPDISTSSEQTPLGAAAATSGFVLPPWFPAAAGILIIVGGVSYLFFKRQ